MTIAEQLKHDLSKGSLELYDTNGNEVYYESLGGDWCIRQYDSDSTMIYFENSYGTVVDDRTKEKLKNKEIDDKLFALIKEGKRDTPEYEKLVKQKEHQSK